MSAKHLQLLMGGVSAGTDPFETGLAYWPFTADFTDSSGNGNNGTGVGSPTIGPTYGYSALELSGLDKYVDIFNSETVPTAWQDLSDAITINYWRYGYNPAEHSDAASFWIVPQTVIELRTQNSSNVAKVPFACGFAAYDTINILPSLGVASSGTSANERAQIANEDYTLRDTWHMDTFVIDGDNWIIYGDGVALASGTFASATADRSVGTTSSNMQIGCRSRDAGEKDRNEMWKAVGRFSVMKSVATPTQVLARYNSTKTYYGVV